MTAADEPFSYDRVAYETKATEDAHPQALGAIAALFGIDAAPPSRCRLLEIGCGDGENLFAMAAYLPHAELVGYDLSAVAVARGQATLAALGLPNARIERRSILDPDPGYGAFDYVVAHGVYSWVPDEVKDGLLRAIRASLAPRGVAFVSFNALPGWDLAGALRALVRERASDVADPREKVRLALETTEAIAIQGARDGGFGAVLARYAAEYLRNVIPQGGDTRTFVPYVFHDTLAELNDPRSLGAFAAHAARHGLRYLAESPLLFGRGDRFADARAWLEGRAPDDPIDLVTCAAILEGTQFVGAILCRDDAPALAAPDPARMRDQVVGSRAQRLAPSGAHARYGVPGSRLGVDVRSPLGVALFDHLAAIAPAVVPVERALDAARAIAGTREGEDEALEDLLAACARQLVRAFAEPLPCVLDVSERPRAASFVRHRAAEALRDGRPRAMVVTATHMNLVTNALALAVLAQLDGTRDVAAIAEDLRRAIASGELALPTELAPLRAAAPEAMRKLVTELLAGQAKLGLLVG